MQNMQTQTVKVTICGPAKSGKSALLLKLVDAEEKINENYTPTMGVDFKIRTRDQIKLQIWDLAGQEGYYSITASYLHNAKLVLFTVDLSQAIGAQKEYILKAKRELSDTTLCFVVGTKKDIKPQMISSEELHSLAEELGTSLVFKCSAKTGEKVDILMDKIFQELKRILKPVQSSEEAPLVTKPKQSCWASFCSCLGKKSTAKEDVSFDSSEQNGSSYSRLES